MARTAIGKPQLTPVGADRSRRLTDAFSQAPTGGGTCRWRLRVCESGVSRVYCPDAPQSEDPCGVDKGNCRLWSVAGVLAGLAGAGQPRGAIWRQGLTPRFRVRAW